jgi:hypothetical protein
MTSRTLLVSSCALASSVLLAGGAAADPPDLATPSIDAAPPSVTNSQTAHFEFSSTDSEVTFFCSLDGAPFSECDSPQEQDYASLPEGAHTFAVKTSRDPPGPRESSPATHNWLIDLTPPGLSLTSPANGSATSVDTPTFAGGVGTAPGDETAITLEIWTGADLLRSFPATVDTNTGTWSATPDEALPDGSYTARARQADAAGNSGVSTASFAVDTTQPVFAAVGASQIIEQTSPAGAVAAYAPPATDELDPAPRVDCSPPSGAVVPAGVTTVSCRATDWAGNSAETQFTVTVANTIRPAALQGLRAQAAKGRVGLSWKSPTDWDYDRLVVRRTPRETTMWRVVYEGRSATTFTDRDVQNDTEYVYEATVYDTAGNASASISTRARPSAFLWPRWNAALRKPPALRWAEVRKAAYYNVQVWRNGRKILSRWPGGPRFRLQRTWIHQGRRYSLADGTYFAYAWPGFGPRNAGRYGRLIGWTKFRIS